MTISSHTESKGCCPETFDWRPPIGGRFAKVPALSRWRGDGWRLHRSPRQASPGPQDRQRRREPPFAKRLRSAPVGQHSRQDVAGRAGVDPEYVDRLVELGILKPGAGDTFTTGDVRRARWLHGFEGAGVPIEGIAASVREGTLSFTYLDATAFDRFPGMTSTTFRELSERSGVPLDLLRVVREVLGFAEPGPDDHVREDEMAVVRSIELQLSYGIGSEVIERLLRAYGDSMRKIVETETDWYRSEVQQPLLE